MITRQRFSIFLIAVLLLSGCGTMQAYSGPQLPKEQVAVVKSNILKHPFTTIVIAAVDGKSRSGARTNVEVLPGRHTLDLLVNVTVWYVTVNYPASISFEAEAGKVYFVDAKIVNGQPLVWVVDEQTNEVVAGEKA